MLKLNVRGSAFNFRWKILKIAGIASILLSSLAIVAPASAGSNFDDHLWNFANGMATNTIDFNKGGSKIYDSVHLHIATDDYMYLDAPVYVRTQNNLQVGNQLQILNNGNHAFNGSALYDNVHLHIATDDYMYLDAPNSVNVSDDLNVGGDVTANTYYGDGSNLTGISYTGGSSFDGITINDDGTDSNSIAYYYDNGDNFWRTDVQSGAFILYNSDNEFNALTVDASGNTTINSPDRHATLRLANDGDLNVEGNTTLGSSHWDDLTVNATSTFNNDVILGGRIYGAGHVGGDVTGDPVTIGRYALGDATYHPGLTVWGDTTLKGDVLIGGDDSVDSTTALNVSNENGDQFFNVDTSNGIVTLGKTTGGYNCFSSGPCSEINLNGRLYSDTGVVTVGRKSDQQDFRVWGDVTLGSGTSDWNCFSNSCSSINLNGRLFSETGTITLGRQSDNTDLQVFGDSSLRGDVQVIGDVYNDDGDVTVGDNLVIDSGNWESEALKVLNPEGQRVFNVNTDFNRVSVGHWDTTTELKVWGDTELVSELNVRGDSFFNSNVQFDGTVNSDLIPGTDDNYDLGAGGARWRNGYFSGTIYAANIAYTNLSTTGNITDGGNLFVTGNSTINGNENVTGNIVLTGNFVGNGNITSTANVNFTGATSLRVPISSNDLTDGADASNTCSAGNKADLQLDTSNSLFVCDGTNWQQLDN